MTFAAILLGLTAGFATTGGVSVNAGLPIVQTFPGIETAVTEQMQLSAGGMTVTLGFDSWAGEYGNSTTLDAGFGGYAPGRNLTVTKCGRGNQGAGFDNGHDVGNGDNDTQAGQTKTKCTQTVPRWVDERTLCSGAYDMALFSNAGYPIERTEQQTEYCYRDASSLHGVPAMVVNQLVTYLGMPNAITQFASQPNFQVSNLVTPWGTLSTGNNDRAGYLATYGIRVRASDFPYLIWRTNGVYHSELLTTDIFDCTIGAVDTKLKYTGGTKVRHNITNCGGVDDDLMGLSHTSDPNVGPFIGLREPKSGADAAINLSETYFGSTPGSLHVQSYFRGGKIAINDDCANINGIHDCDQTKLILFDLTAAQFAPPNGTSFARWAYQLYCVSAIQCFEATDSFIAAGYTGFE